MQNSDNNAKPSDIKANKSSSTTIPQHTPIIDLQGASLPSRPDSPASGLVGTQGTTTGESPFDLSIYLAFPSATSGLGQSPNALNEDVYKAFAQGIKTTQGSQVKPQQIPHQLPQSSQRRPASGDSKQDNQGIKSEPEAQTNEVSMQNMYNPRGNNAPQTMKLDPQMSQPQSSQNQLQNSTLDSSTGLSPYGLDPSAFQTEVRFQLPAFLNPTSTAPTHPNGAEVWSGYGLHSAAMESFSNAPRQQFGGTDMGEASGNTGFGMGSKLFGTQADHATGNNFGTTMNGMGQVPKWQQPMMQAMSNQQQGQTGLRSSPAAQGASVDVGMAHTDSGGLSQWDNWSFNADPMKPFHSPGAFQYSTDQQTGGQNVGQTPTYKLQPSVTSGNNSNSGLGRATGSDDAAAMTARMQVSTGADLTMPTSALLSSSYPGSASFASSSNMNIPSSVMPQGAAGNANVLDGAAGGIPHTADSAFASSSTSASAVAAHALANGALDGLVQPGTFATQTPGGVNMPGLYSATGFDMVSVLSRVAARRDPKSVLGPVDCSCSFTVVDIRKYDHPIVYSSPTFSTLTGYDNREIVGRNCRFLQSPDAEVVKGSRRKYTDNEAVAHMKRMLGAGKECQASLINYRKGGTPFINLVTIVPIPWDTDEIVYHVGFQVDLVEQPNAILRNMRDGSYQVNYTVMNNPQPSLKTLPPKALIEPPSIKTIGLKQEQLDLIGPMRANAAAAIGGEDAGKSEWLKFVLEETDDFVHVLSLKGQFHYVSPSVSRVLEYEPEDLLNKHISDICHPSDIVPVMRELKDSSQTPVDGQLPRPFNLLFRIRRKYSGYIWLESTGKLHLEAGKSRKAVILTGRERSVPMLKWKTIDDHGGLGECEFWANISFDGLFLWASGTSDQVIGVKSEELVGRSIYAFLAGGKNGPPQANGHPSALSIQKALAQAGQGLPKKGATSIRHQLVAVDGRTREVTSIFYAAGYPAKSAGTVSPPTPDSSDSEGSTDSTSSHLLAEVKPSHILLQIKMSGPQWPRSTNPLANSPNENVFEEMDTTRGTSWQYEIHQLRIANRKLNEEVESARHAVMSRLGGVPDGDSKKKTKKRKIQQSGEGYSYGSPFGMPLNPRHPAPRPSVEHPAPLHQQTPGFGLASGQLFKTW
ncbi:hypothetical protein QFC19_006182 [Naganishia cerealis]|uniref:Uncharacterized protein n=1 Tax=Naganishia cerealis TaxID=610337 RepID=A0ACC2VIQ3_9TREE|nr:hypothetical protein QFC19_006182 [Naganishia cerealis]